MSCRQEHPGHFCPILAHRGQPIITRIARKLFTRHDDLAIGSREPANAPTEQRTTTRPQTIRRTSWRGPHVRSIGRDRGISNGVSHARLRIPPAQQGDDQDPRNRPATRNRHHRAVVRTCL